MEANDKVPMLRLLAHQEYSYVPRTGENARGADVTVAFATDFTTAGERLTKREAGPRYIGIRFGEDPVMAAESLAKFMQARKATSLNVAGNGIYTLSEHGVTQEQANQWVYEVLYRVKSEVPLSLIRSGGQTGVDQAGLVAAIALYVPALGLYPKSYRQRNAAGEEVHSTAKRLGEQLLEQAAKLVRPRGRRYHVDGTLPEKGEVFVFGSNLAGRHGKGAALVARERFGATPGTGRGRMGQSYGIPTKRNGPVDSSTGRPTLVTRTLDEVKADILDFVAYATHNQQEEFFVTRVGCQLAGFEDRQIAILFADAPDNCSFPEPWEPYLRNAPSLGADAPVQVAEAVNIYSGSRGIGGALTNMSEIARRKGCIKHSYPVTINDVRYEDSEAAYQALKIHGDDDYNDGLMIDIIALKFEQNPDLLKWVKQDGGVAWLEKCSHFTNAKSPRAQSWEGQGRESRFIRNLIHGYEKAVAGRGPLTRVVHVKEAPFDVYIGRAMGQGFTESIWANQHKVGALTREQAVEAFHNDIKGNSSLMAQVGSLKGRTLGCWCKTRESRSLLCHGDVLVALAEGKDWVPPQAAQASLF